jgi:hypothetical protein
VETSASAGGHEWLPRHRLGAPRRGPITTPRDLDVSDLRPEVWTPVPSSTESGAVEGLVRELRDDLTREGWTVAIGTPSSGGPALLAERDLRMDLSALRMVHLFQAACAVEFGGAIALGFLWPTWGHPTWQGEGITGLAILGAIGLIRILARVDFVSQVLVVERAAGLGVPDAGSKEPRAPPWGRIWSTRAWSRNWEVLGDRGGRRMLEMRSTAASRAAAAMAAARLTGSTPEVDV